MLASSDRLAALVVLQYLSDIWSFWDADSIFEAARSLLKEVDLSGMPLRLIGLNVSDFSGEGQKILFPDEKKVRGETLQRLTDSVTDKFGQGLLTRATLLTDE